MKIQINNKSNVFFCSDPHFGHSGIVYGTSTWSSKETSCRKFLTIEDHDNELVNNINATVGVDDILFCLGDWSFGNYSNEDNINNISRFRNRLHCKTIHLILGNHDTEIRDNKNNCRDLFSSINNYLEIVVIDKPEKENQKPCKYRLTLCHYSMNMWNHSSRGSLHLFGHSHGNLSVIRSRSMDVGFDTHPEFRPYSFQEIQQLLCNQLIENVDHH